MHILSPLGTAFGKQTSWTRNTKKIKNLNQLKTFSKKNENEIKNEIYETKKWEEKIEQGDSKYEADKYKFDF